jgi:UDP-2,3-diacylglucosamine hydrolase
MTDNKTYFFISDIHLGLDNRQIEKEKEKKLISFLHFAQKNCSELFIVGDLFDYWFEYKRVIQKGFFKTLSALTELSECGVKIHYFIGNHDFLHRDFFVKEVGAILYYDAIDIELNGKRFFIGHGDGLIKNDTGYNILKKILRNKILQRFYSAIHPDLGIRIASSTSKKSRDYTSQKNYGTVDGLLETAKLKIESGYNYVLFGHSHVRALDKINNGIYINLGSWLERPCYGKYNDTFEIIDWK